MIRFRANGATSNEASLCLFAGNLIAVGVSRQSGDVVVLPLSVLLVVDAVSVK